MIRRTFVVVVLAVLIAAAMTGVAWGDLNPPFNQNSQCTDCHQPLGAASAAPVDFEVTSVAPVNRATACVKCHWEPFGSHPYHNTTWNCGACHSGWGAVDYTRMPLISTAYGYFNTASSALADENTLHVIHSNPSWIGTANQSGRQCSSCHAAAACTACHESGVSASHRDHAWDDGQAGYVAPYGPASKAFGMGTSVGNEYERDVNTALTCSNTTCHDLTSGSYDPILADDTSPTVSYSPAGDWVLSSTSGYLKNTFTRSKGTGDRATLTFTGQRVDFVAGLHPYNGKARIYIDGVATTTVDLYSAAIQKQVVMYTSPKMRKGTHTIAVEVMGQHNAASRDNYVQVDGFMVYPQIDTNETSCTVCHSPDTYSGVPMDRVQIHGADPAVHTATETAGFINTTSTVQPNVGCTSKCHTNRVDTEHLNVIATATPVALADGHVTCPECHNDPKWAACKPWNEKCTACHTLHPRMVTAHNWTSSSAALCGGVGCHDVTHIDRIHNNATTTSPEPLKNCNVCHRNGLKPAGFINGGAPATQCIDCHGSHAGWDHTATSASDSCINCHTTTGRDLKAIHGGTSSCTTCHGNPKYPNLIQSGRHECTDCHNSTVMAKNYTPDATHYAGTETTHTFTPPAATITISGVAYGPYPCTNCHSTELGVEHAKSSSSSSPFGCLACHPSLTSQLPQPLNKLTCAQGGCHTVSPDLQHSMVTASHATLAVNASCMTAGCHSGNLASIHLSAETTITGDHRVSCRVCHGGGVPATADCTSCHGSKVAWQHGNTPAQHNAIATDTITIVYKYTPAGNTTITSIPETFSVGCGTCHGSVDVSQIHGAAPGSCQKCHTSIVPTKFSVWNDRCDTAGCHSSSETTRVAHANIDTAHDIVPVAKDCFFGSFCHKAGSLPQVHSQATTTVAGVTYTGCQVCHRNSLTPVVIPDFNGWQNECLGCHPDRLAEHGYTAANHQSTIVTQTVVINGISYQNIRCADCHALELGPEHITKHGLPCSNCHPSPQDTLLALGGWNKKTCSQGGCHTTTGGYTPQHSVISTDHAPLPNTRCMRPGCHLSNSIAPHGIDLVQIHQSMTTTVNGAQVSGCLVCHFNNEYRPNGETTPTFQCDQYGIPNTKDCATCHPVGNNTMHAYNPDTHTSAPGTATISISGKSYGTFTCTDCHFAELALEHARNTSGFRDQACTLCHPQPYESLDPSGGPPVGGWSKGCVQGGCHTAVGQTQHHSIDATHQPRPQNVSCFTSNHCHTNSGGNLASIHSNATSTAPDGSQRTACFVCHVPADFEAGPASADCLVCHPGQTVSHVVTDTLHPSPSASTCGSDPKSCHYMTLAREHLRRAAISTGTTMTCDTCHASANPTVINAIANKDMRCEACHILSPTHGAAPVGNNMCTDCHGTTSTAISQVSTTGAYANTAGDHLTGYASSAHSTVTTLSVQRIQCTICHDHNAGVMKDLEYRYTTGTPDWTKPGTNHENMCYLCHNTNAVPAEPGKPNTYTGRDIQAEFSRPSKHTLSAGGNNYVENSYNVLTQSTLADFNSNPLLNQLQVTSVVDGEVKLGQDNSGAINPPVQTDLIFSAPGSATSYDQYKISENAWNGSNSAIFQPASLPVSPASGSSSFKLPNDNHIYVVSGATTYQYTPQADPTLDSWVATANLAPGTTIGAGGDTAVDTTGTTSNGQCVYYDVASTTTRFYWRGYQSPYSTNYGNFYYNYSTFNVGQGSAMAYSQLTNRLFLLNKNGASNDGCLYYATPGRPAAANVTFTKVSGVALAPSASATWNRMCIASIGGTDYLFVLGTNSAGSPTLQVVTNLASTPTLLSIGLKIPAGWTSVGNGCDLFYNASDGCLYATQGGGLTGFAKLQVPVSPGVASSWTGVSWTGLNSSEIWNAGASIATASCDPVTNAPFKYYTAGVMQSVDVSGTAYDHWGYVVYHSVTPSGTLLTTRVQGVNGSTVTTLVASASASPINLTNYLTSDYPKLRLTFTLSTSVPSSPTCTPELDDWTVTAYKGQWMASTGSTVECENCHNTHKVQKGSGVWDPNRLSDPSNTKTLWAGTVTDFCLKCHTGTYAAPQSYAQTMTATLLVPYPIAFRAVPAPFFPGWSKTVAGVSFTASGHYTSTNPSKAGCQNCHDPHGSDLANLEAWTPTSGATVANSRVNTGTSAFEENLCYHCHNSTSGVGKTARYLNVQSPETTGTYGHLVGKYSNRHSDEETVGVFANLSTRHVECVDCHDPHASQPGTHTAGSSLGAPAILGVWGEVPPTASLWTTPAPASYTATRLAGQSTGYEAYLCFKCHAGPGRPTQSVSTSSGTYVPTDLALEFNPNNASGHNVLGDVFTKNFTSGSYTWSAPTASSLGLSNAWTVNSQMTCTDCHTDGGGTQSRGPHGSAMKWMLKYGNGTEWYTTQLGNYASASNMCNACHTSDPHTSWEGQNSAHTGSSVTCRHCHITIPHGWKRPAMLLGSGDIAPYKDTTDGNITGFALKSYSSGSGPGGSAGDCSDSCSSSRHPSVGSYW